VANLVGASVIIILLAVASLPYGFWIKTFAPRVASGPHAAEFLVYMAALGELSAVKALLDEGVPIDARDKRGLTAMQAAENAKQPEVLAYLASRTRPK
jgi:hypothetical protein